MPREDRLPKWAQEELARLRRELRRSERELDRHIQRGDFMPGDFGNCRVPKKMQLHSAESAVDWGAIRVTFRDDGEVEVSNTGGLRIEPMSSNVARVTSKDD